MVPLVFLHDGSFEGVLTAVAAAVKARQDIQGIYSSNDYIPSLFDITRSVVGDREQAERLFGYIKNLSAHAVHIVINAYLSEDRYLGMCIFRFVKLSLKHGESALDLHSDEAIRSLLVLAGKVDREAHRLKGLIRFRILDDGRQYAPFSSDHNVIGYLAHHFSKRLACSEWVLHDIGRDLAIFWDGKTLQAGAIDKEITAHVGRTGELPDEQLCEKEQHYQGLWRSFHRSIANPDRENRVLQRQFMPRRYWQFLVEMDKF